MPSEPLWKQNLAKATTPEARAKSHDTKREKRSLREDIDAVLNSLAGDSLGRQAWIRRFALGSDENQRALLQARVRLEPQEIRGEVSAALTVRVVTSIGAPIDVKLGPIFPRDAATGRRLPVVPHSASSAPVGDTGVEDAQVIEGEKSDA